MTVRRLLADCTGASAVEFALVLPLLLLFLFGIIDGGRFMWEYNRATKATQVGVRVAAVTNVLAEELATKDYVGVNGLTQGDVIPAADFTPVTCTSTGCGSGYTFDSTTFNSVLLPRMQAIDPEITAANVQVNYSGSGLGYAGDPNGIDAIPIVTVKLTGLTFVPITTLMFATISMPSFSSSMPGEDLSGTQSN